MKNIAYIRVSTDNQDYKHQKNRILEYAQKEKIIIDDFVEINISSRKNEREREISKLFDILKSGDSLLLTELSRLGRNMIEVLNIINNFREKNIKIYFINQPELSSSDNPALDSLKYAIYGFLAESERDFISNRTKQALENIKKERLKNNPNFKFGHNKDFLKSKYDSYEEKIYELREHFKMSFEKICVMLDLDKSKGFKKQSLMIWFKRRYEKDLTLDTYQKTIKYENFIKNK